MTALRPRNALSPRVMLATAMHSQPGVYALLLGSGVSTGAGIPTGWGVVTNLVSRVAVAADPDDTDSHARAASNPEGWWAERGAGELGYSSLLAAMAPTPAARQGILQDYFVPTDEDREQNLKIPSPAHHSVAQLVKRGAVKVILTTNFDRLTEQALDAAGVHYQVISRPEAVAGMTPLPHASATVIKLHGDYAELDSRNTIHELTEYPDEWTDLLRRVFTEYGLVISGWSGEWDKALVHSLQSAPVRYPLYWDHRSSKGEVAQHLLSVHRGNRIEAGSADELFADLSASVEALAELAEPPLTTAMAVARLKRCLPDPVRRIELHDLVMGSAEQIAVSVAEMGVNSSDIDSLDERLKELLAVTTPLLHLLVAGVHHDDAGVHTQLWTDVLQRLLDARVTLTGHQIPINLQHYPALLALRAMSLVAINRGREDLVVKLLTTPEWDNPANSLASKLPAEVLHLQIVLDGNWIDQLPRWGGGNGWLYPQSHLLRSDLSELFAQYLSGPGQYETLSDDAEYLTGLVQELRHGSGTLRANSGEFVVDRRWVRDDPSVPASEVRFRARLTSRGPIPGLLPGEDDWDDAHLDTYRETLRRYRRWG
jgi:hypothetical protein